VRRLSAYISKLSNTRTARLIPSGYQYQGSGISKFTNIAIFPFLSLFVLLPTNNTENPQDVEENSFHHGYSLTSRNQSRDGPRNPSRSLRDDRSEPAGNRTTPDQSSLYGDCRRIPLRLVQLDGQGLLFAWRSRNGESYVQCLFPRPCARTSDSCIRADGIEHKGKMDARGFSTRRARGASRVGSWSAVSRALVEGGC
jgi:hypothetical protein